MLANNFFQNGAPYWPILFLAIEAQNISRTYLNNDVYNIISFWSQTVYNQNCIFDGIQSHCLQIVMVYITFS
jgi:hypothetical protein